MKAAVVVFSHAVREKIGSLPANACQRVDLEDGRSLIAVRRGSKPVLFLNRCPHRGTELDWTPGVLLAVDGYHIQCATHGALFDPESGNCISGPCMGQALQRMDPPS